MRSGVRDPEPNWDQVIESQMRIFAPRRDIEDNLVNARYQIFPRQQG